MSQPEPELRRRNEKDEKDEKSRGEKDHGEKDEKSRGEKGRGDPLSSIVWAFIFVWAGVVLLLENLNILTVLRIDSTTLETWQIICLGAGVIVALEVVIRLILPEYRRPVIGSIIFAGILLAIGLGEIVTWDLIWPVIIILIGVAILLGTIIRR